MSLLLFLRLRCSAAIFSSSWTNLRLRKKELFLYFCVTILVAYPEFLLSNTQTFLTDLGMASTTAASIVNLQDGTPGICAIGGAILCDRYISPYGLIISASVFYSLGLAIVTGSCHHLNTGGGIKSVRWLVAIGLFLRAIGGLSLINSARALSGLGQWTLRSVESVLRIILSSVVFSVVPLTLGVYEELDTAPTSEDNKFEVVYLYVGPFLVATILLFVVTAISFFYLKVEPFLKPIEKREAPITVVARVYWAAFKKRSLPLPKNSDDLYTEKSDSEHNSEHTVLLEP